LVLVVIVQILSFFFFVKGFFPTKVVLQGNGTNYVEHLKNDDALYDKLIFMVVDAMRSDFVFSNDSNMPFVHSLINGNKAIGFTAFSNPPTVTLPRLKGITTGSTPSFLDAILNIAEDDTSSTLGDQDSWVKELYLKGKNINMYGDDTWLKLFPKYFSKIDGTSSFYVSDFTEVDNNVTRHLDEELSSGADWDVLILHYLGLDHIGHQGGPKSSNMPIKQLEMDDIIKRIYEEHLLKNEKTLFVVLGDHGMNEIGNHGGSSIGETSAALLFISNNFQKFVKNVKAPLLNNENFEFYSKIQQIDIVPTLASLLNFPIPKNNLGILIESFKPIFGNNFINALLENAFQFKNLIETSFADRIYEFMKKCQAYLSNSSTNYNYFQIYTGFGIFIFTSLLIVIYYLISSYNTGNFYLSIVGILFSSLLALSSVGSSMIEEEYQIWWWFITLFFTGILFYLKASNFTSATTLLALRLIRGWNNSGQKNNLVSNLKISKILGENFLINWALVGMVYCSIIYLVCKGGLTHIFNSSALSFISIFLLVSLNFTNKLILSFLQEEKDVSYENFPKVFLNIIQWTVDILGVEDVKDCLNPIFKLFYLTFFILIIGRVAFQLMTRTKMVNFLGNETSISKVRSFYFNDLANILTLLLLNQTSLKNIPLYLLFIILRQNYISLFKSLIVEKNIFKISLFLTSLNIFMQNFSFFSFGNTNSLSSIDLTNAFNGLSEYNLLLCGILTFVANWSGPIFWSLSFYLTVLSEFNKELQLYKYDLLYYKLLISSMFYSIVGCGLIGSCILLRYHLFIWTVFSPKLLYFGSWYVFMNFGVDFILS
ncbi:hypothetical protein PACTADRAFT_27578, partial [Pachysolen tannophilus NRRL Y-2460]